MKNREKFAEQIIDIALSGGSIAINMETGKPCDCNKTECTDCIFYSKREECSDAIKEWAEKEYEEPPVDWSKVPVDTPILVRICENESWKARHFAKYEDGKVHTWGCGTTSWSNDGRGTYTWKFAKLAEGTEYD